MASPSGQRLDDGFSTQIEFSLNPTISLWEKEVQPYGFDGGEAIDTTTMRNVTLRTFNPQSLQTTTPGTFKVAYDEGDITAIRAMINKYQQVTVRFPTGVATTFWGYLKSFVPDALVIGQQPTATVVIQNTNQTSAHTEAGPTVYEDAVGGGVAGIDNDGTGYARMETNAEHGIEDGDLVWVTTPGFVGLYKASPSTTPDPDTFLDLQDPVTGQLIDAPGAPLTGGRIFKAVLYGTFTYTPSDSGSVISISPNFKAIILEATGNGGPNDEEGPAGGGGAYSRRQITTNIPATLTLEIHGGASPGTTKARGNSTDYVAAAGSTSASGAASGVAGQVNNAGGNGDVSDAAGQAGQPTGNGGNGAGTGLPGDGGTTAHPLGYDGQIVMRAYILA